MEYNIAISYSKAINRGDIKAVAGWEQEMDFAAEVTPSAQSTSGCPRRKDKHESGQ